MPDCTAHCPTDDGRHDDDATHEKDEEPLACLIPRGRCRGGGGVAVVDRACRLGLGVVCRVCSGGGRGRRRPALLRPFGVCEEIDVVTLLQNGSGGSAPLDRRRGTPGATAISHAVGTHLSVGFAHVDTVEKPLIVSCRHCGCVGVEPEYESLRGRW